MSSANRWRLALGAVFLVIIILGGLRFWQPNLFKKTTSANKYESKQISNEISQESQDKNDGSLNDDNKLNKSWKPGESPVLPDTNVLNSSDIIPNFVEQKVASLKDIKNYKALQIAYNIKLSSAEEAYLLKNNFLLIPLERSSLINENGWDEMLKSFDKIQGPSSISLRAPQNAKLVTPDIVLHAYHRFFENTLEELEKHELSTTLSAFLVGLTANLKRDYNADLVYQPAPAPLKSNYQRLLAQVAVATTLLQNHGPAKPDGFNSPEAEMAFTAADKTADSLANAQTILAKYTKDLPVTLQTQAKDELKLIYAHQGLAISPLFSVYAPKVRADYSQYTPRSHYNKLSELRAYFRAMMYLGRNSYFLSSDEGLADTNLLWRAIGQELPDTGSSPLASWKRIMGVTGFYAGSSDDLTYTEWNDFISNQILAHTQYQPEQLVSQDILNKEVAQLYQLRLPRIISDVIIDENVPNQTKSDLLRQSLAFRLFGQRFTYDAWVLNDLTAGQKKTGVALPSLPSALFVPAALGDARATDYIKTLLVKERNFTSGDADTFVAKPLVKKQADLSAVKNTEWFSSLSSAWIYLLGSLTKSYGAGYPLYMQATTFADKQIQTFLGSYTELKHDTVLYAKQSYAELGGGGDESVKIPPVPKGFVEPNLTFWRKLSALITYNQQLFKQHDVFTDHVARERLREFGDIITFYSQLAEKELQNQPITDAEYEKLRTTNLAFVADPFQAEDPGPNDWQTALVTDIHTDAVTGQILYEGTERPYLMLAIVSNENSPRLVLSPVFNHVEFAKPIGPRATDEEWRAKVYGNTTSLPSKNFWYDSLLVK